MAISQSCRGKQRCERAAAVTSCLGGVPGASGQPLCYAECWTRGTFLCRSLRAEPPALMWCQLILARGPETPSYSSLGAPSSPNGFLTGSSRHDQGPPFSGLLPRSERPVFPIGVPQVKVFTKEPLQLGKRNTLVCSVSNLFPPSATITWERDGMEVTQWVSTTQIYPVGELEFQLFSYLEMVPQEGDVYSCMVRAPREVSGGMAYWGESRSPASRPTPAPASLLRLTPCVSPLASPQGSHGFRSPRDHCVQRGCRVGDRLHDCRNCPPCEVAQAEGCWYVGPRGPSGKRSGRLARHAFQRLKGHTTSDRWCVKIELTE